MRILCTAVAVLALATGASAAPNVTNVTQKGSLLVFPFVAVSPSFSTLIRLQNDGSSDVDVKCYWMDWNKHRVDFIIPMTRNQPVWFDARSGNGSLQVNRYPTGAANGFSANNRHPFSDIAADGFSVIGHGMLACWAVDGGAQNQIKWNHLSGTATFYNLPGAAAFEYNAYAFFAPTGIDLQPVGGTPGTMNLNGVDYDACPLYQIGQFTPAGAIPPQASLPFVAVNQLFMASCDLDLRQDWTPAWTKWQFDVWNEDEVKFTGAYECADSWHETVFNQGTLQRTDTGVAAAGAVGYAFVDGLDAAAQNFSAATLGTYAARYRVQGVKSSQCDRIKPASGTGSSIAAVTTKAVGLLGVHVMHMSPGVGNPVKFAGTTLTGAGKTTGKVTWDPTGGVPEGGVR